MKDDGRVKWFGESWGAPICDPAERVDVPIGRLCMKCDREILAGAQGLSVVHLGQTENGQWSGGIRQPWHLGCWLTSVLPPGPVGVEVDTARMAATGEVRVIGGPPDNHELMVLCHDKGLAGVWQAGRDSWNALEAGKAAGEALMRMSERHEVALELASRRLQMLRGLIARIDRDGGQRQAGETLEASVERADRAIAERYAAAVEILRRELDATEALDPDAGGLDAAIHLLGGETGPAGRIGEEDDRHGMTHPMCDACWSVKRGGEPVRHLPEVCCFCGKRTGSGIYVRATGREVGFCPDTAHACPDCGATAMHRADCERRAEPLPRINLEGFPEQVHVMRDGRALCGRPGPPWAPWHRERVGDEEVTCEGCRRVA